MVGCLFFSLQNFITFIYTKITRDLILLLCFMFGISYTYTIIYTYIYIYVYKFYNMIGIVHPHICMVCQRYTKHDVWKYCYSLSVLLAGLLFFSDNNNNNQKASCIVFIRLCVILSFLEYFDVLGNFQFN